MSIARRAAAVVLAVASAVLLASCTGAPLAQQPQPSQPAPSATAAAGDLTCESILPESLVAEFTDYGQVAIEEPFSFGDPQTTAVPDGIMCTWGNPQVPTDHGVQLFGWAPLDQAGREKWAAFLAEQGWQRSEGDGYEYFSDPFEGPEGVTYAFGDGHVILANTKQGVTLVAPR